MKRLVLCFLVVVLIYTVVSDLPLTCDLFTQISPYILVYTLVEYSNAASVCSLFDGQVASFTQTLNTNYGLWTEGCNFYFNSLVQTVSTVGSLPYTPPFWINSESNGLCGALPYSLFNMLDTTDPATFINCQLSNYVLCYAAATTSFSFVATTVLTSNTALLTVTLSGTTTVNTVVSIDTLTATTILTTESITEQFTSTSTGLSATTLTITEVSTLTGTATTSITRSIPTVTVQSGIVTETVTTTIVNSQVRTVSTTTTATTLRTLYTCVK